MAAYHARSGACRVGATYCGLANRPIDVLVGGATKKSVTVAPLGLSITEYLDGQPSTAQLTFKGDVPSMWSDLVIRRGGATSDLLWGGTITGIKARILGPNLSWWSVQAIGWQWRLDLAARVTAVYRHLSYNTILSRMLANFTDAADGFKVGICADALGSATEMQFTEEPVSAAIGRIAKAANAYWRIRPNKRIDIAQTFPARNSLTLTNTTDARNLQWESTGSQVRTRTFIKGGGSRTSAAVSAGASTIPIVEPGWYSVTGGTVRIGFDTVTYTSVAVTANPVALTGCTGLTQDLQEGEPVYVLAQVNDVAAQTALATALGGGHSGVAVAAFTDGRISTSEASARATNDVAFFKESLPSVQFDIDNRFYRAGQIVTASVTAPLTITGDFRVQSVVITPRDTTAGDNPVLQHRVVGRLARRSDLLDVLVSR